MFPEESFTKAKIYRYSPPCENSSPAIEPFFLKRQAVAAPLLQAPDSVPWLPEDKVVGAVYMSEETVGVWGGEVKSWVASVEGAAPLSAQVLVQQRDSVGSLNLVPQYKEVLLSFLPGFTWQGAVHWLEPLAGRPGEFMKPLQWELWFNEATP